MRATAEAARDVWLLIERVPGCRGWHDVVHPERWRRTEAVREAHWLAAATNHPVLVRRLRGSALTALEAVEVRPG